MADRLLSELRQEHLVEISKTNARRHALSIARDSAANFDAMVAVGGDGTVHECVCGLMEYIRANPGAKLPLFTVVPNGTGNDYARNFQWKNYPGMLSSLLTRNTVRKVDVLEITGNNGVDWAINVLDIGLGPVVVRNVEHIPRILGSSLRFRIAILLGFISFRKRVLSVQSAAGSYSGKSLIIAVAKGKYFGSGIGVSPRAEVSDGKLHVTVVGDVSVWTYLRHLGTLKKCQPISHRGVKYLEATEIELGNSGAIETDGEMSHLELPVKVIVRPAIIPLLV